MAPAATKATTPLGSPRRCRHPAQTSSSASAASATKATSTAGPPACRHSSHRQPTAVAAIGMARKRWKRTIHGPGCGRRLRKRGDEGDRAGTGSPGPVPSGEHQHRSHGGKQQCGAERGAEERPGARRRDEGGERAGGEAAARPCPPADRRQSERADEVERDRRWRAASARRSCAGPATGTPSPPRCPRRGWRATGRPARRSRRPPPLHRQAHRAAHPRAPLRADAAPSGRGSGKTHGIRLSRIPPSSAPRIASSDDLGAQ